MVVSSANSNEVVFINWVFKSLVKMINIRGPKTGSLGDTIVHCLVLRIL